MGKIIGIDLGTTNSAVAVYENERASIFENAQGKRTTPSVIALKINKDKSTEWIVGDAAKRQAAMNPLRTMYGVKRLIGRRFDEAEVQKMKELASYKIVAGPNGDAWVEVDGKPMAPAEISAKILMELKKSVEDQLGEKITEAVITVPAYFNDAQRQATIDAGKIAGLDVKRIINEPTSAALAYGMDKQRGGKIAVYDLGGGTFDVSILEVMVDDEAGSLIKVISTNGDTFLGGENFDELITEHLIKTLNSENGTNLSIKDKNDASLSDEERKKSIQAIQRLREEAEKAKIALSKEEMVDITVPFIMTDEDGTPINFETSLTRKQLEAMLKPLIEKSIEPCKKALADAGLKVSDLDDIILVGGQTRMPLVVETVKAFFGKEPRRDVNPDEIVAMGASVQGAILTGKVDNVLLADVTPLSIGIRTAGDTMSVMVPRNSSIPTTVKETFYNAEDGQRNVHIRLYQGERPKASDNNFLGDFTLEIPPMPAGQAEIAVSFSLDADGVIDVTAMDVKTKREMKITVKPNGGLSEAQVAQMRKDAEANAAADQAFRETQAATANAEAELKDVDADRQAEWFTAAPADLKKEFEDTVAELTKAKAQKDVPAMVAGAEKLKEVRLRIGSAFNESASSEAAAEAPEASQSTDAPAQEKPAAPKGPSA